MYVHVFVEAVLLDISFEDFNVLLDFGEVKKALFFWVSVLVYSHETDGSVVNVAKDEALTFVWGKVGHFRFLPVFCFRNVVDCDEITNLILHNPCYKLLCA